MEIRYYRLFRGLLLAAFMFASFAASGASAKDYVVIVNKSVPDDEVSSSELKNIFLAKKRQWSNAKKIKISLYRNNALQTNFLQTAIKKSRMKFEIYWKKLIFTGKASMPKRVSTESAIVAFVKSTPGAIGFVSAKTDIAGVKVLKVSQ